MSLYLHIKIKRQEVLGFRHTVVKLGVLLPGLDTQEQFVGLNIGYNSIMSLGYYQLRICSPSEDRWVILDVKGEDVF